MRSDFSFKKILRICPSTDSVVFRTCRRTSSVELYLANHRAIFSTDSRNIFYLVVEKGRNALVNELALPGAL